MVIITSIQAPHHANSELGIFAGTLLQFGCPRIKSEGGGIDLLLVRVRTWILGDPVAERTCLY